jgi:hypothetical protein
LGAHQLDNEDSYEELDDDENNKEKRKNCEEQNDEY